MIGAPRVNNGHDACNESLAIPLVALTFNCWHFFCVSAFFHMVYHYLIVQTTNDGTFWMSFDDFLAHFTQIEVAKCHRGWEVVNISGMKIPAGMSQF